jgi:hypothetical protein
VNVTGWPGNVEVAGGGQGIVSNAGVALCYERRAQASQQRLARQFREHARASRRTERRLRLRPQAGA